MTNKTELADLIKLAGDYGRAKGHTEIIELISKHVNILEALPVSIEMRAIQRATLIALVADIKDLVNGKA